MVELGAKIKRKVYKFDLRKRFLYELHYRVKQRPPIERLKDQLRSLTAPKKEEKRALAEPSGQPPGGFNFFVLGAFIFIALIILGLAWLYLSLQFQAGAGLFVPQVEKPSITNAIESGEILSGGVLGAPEYSAAIFVDYSTANLNNYSVNLTTYATKIPSEVFILNSERKGATTYANFMRVLRFNLAKRKIMLNEISLKQLETVPEGALIIIPSGVIPKEILGFDSQLSMNKLADRGMVVVFIGKPFKEMLNGTESVFTPQNTLSNLPVRFDETTSLSSSEGFNLFQPLYRATPGGGWQSALAYGSVSMITKGDGAFIFLPQTLDAGWRGDYTSAADDVSRIIFETPWAEPNAQSKVYEFVNQTEYSGRQYFISQPFEEESASVKVEFTGYPSTSNISVRETLLIHLTKERDNNLYIESSGKVVPANITNLPIRINAQLREPRAGQPTMFLSLVNVNGTEVATYPLDNVDIQGDHSWDELVYVDRGEYLMRLIDDAGTEFAATYMKVVSIDITYLGTDPEKNSIYQFEVTMDGIPKMLSEVSVKVDNGDYGTYKFNNVESMRVDVNQYTGGERLPLGKHSFEFTAGGLKVMLPVEHSRTKNIFDEPIFWGSMLFTGLIVGVGVLFARQEEIFFSLDIPDFPPITRTKVPLGSDAVLGIFEKVNETYRWQYTPLTTSEVKNGFKDIFHEGRPVYITDYNVEYLLVELEKRGQVKESLGYYGLVAWEQKSRHSIEYLAMMRSLRDICVNNAIPFTGINESEEADSVITVVGQQMSLHFYERGMDASRLLARVVPTIGRGIAIILFRNPADKDQLLRIINSSPSIAPLIIKMEADSSSLLLHTMDELEKMLIEFKSM